MGGKKVVGALRADSFIQVYRWVMKRPILWLWGRYGDTTVDEKAGLLAQLRGALTWRLYDVALLLAVFYPIMALVGWWIWNGQAGKLVG